MVSLPNCVTKDIHSLPVILNTRTRNWLDVHSYHSFGQLTMISTCNDRAWIPSQCYAFCMHGLFPLLLPKVCGWGALLAVKRPVGVALKVNLVVRHIDDEWCKQRAPPWLWNPRQLSTEVQIGVPTAASLALPQPGWGPYIRLDPLHRAGGPHQVGIPTSGGPQLTELQTYSKYNLPGRR